VHALDPMTHDCATLSVSQAQWPVTGALAPYSADDRGTTLLRVGSHEVLGTARYPAADACLVPGGARMGDGDLTAFSRLSRHLPRSIQIQIICTSVPVCTPTGDAQGHHSGTRSRSQRR